MTYESISAKELHDIVTRLEARGFKVPEGVMCLTSPFELIWVLAGVRLPVSFVAAIMEVAARDWWLKRGLLPKEVSGAEQDIDWKWNIDVTLNDATAWRPRFGGATGPTPLHAILAALEAK